MSCDTSFRESAIIAQYVFYQRTSCHQTFKKIPTDFSDDANKSSIFVSGWFYAESFFIMSLDHHPVIWLTCWAWITHSGWVGKPLWRCGDCCRLCLKFENLKFIRLSSRSENDETMKRRNDSLRTRNAPKPKTATLSTAPPLRNHF